jgi:hypothetical protein
MSFFKDVIGQEDVKQLLIHSAKNGKMPHAVLLTGPAGSGKLPIALAVARYLLCHHPAENDACGQCNSCKMMDHLAHPDMHFAFPVVRKKAGRDVVCDEFLPQWREMLGRNSYADLQEWMRVIDAGNQQPQIYVRESDEIQRKLSLKASQGGYKVMLIWLPEKMNVECANKLLKLLEEPPLKTVFLLVSEEPDLLLPTIVSRTQLIGNIKSGIRSKRDVRLPRDHDFHPNSPFSRSFDSISDLTGRSKIRIDNLHLTFCSIQCRNIGLTHDFRTSFRNTLHNGHPSSGTLAQRVVWHLSFFQTFVRFLIPYT